MSHPLDRNKHVHICQKCGREIFFLFYQVKDEANLKCPDCGDLSSEEKTTIRAQVAEAVQTYEDSLD